MNYIMTVINPEALQKLVDICTELAMPIPIALHGRGTAVQSMRELLGIDSTENGLYFP